MVAWTNLRAHQTNPKGLEWEKLQPGWVIIDVGGGNGSEGFAIAKRVPNVQVIVQDREQAIQNVTMPTLQRGPGQEGAARVWAG